MIQLDVRVRTPHARKFVCGGWLTPTTYIQLAGAGSKRNFVDIVILTPSYISIVASKVSTSIIDI